MKNIPSKRKNKPSEKEKRSTTGSNKQYQLIYKTKKVILNLILFLNKFNRLWKGLLIKKRIEKSLTTKKQIRRKDEEK